MSLGTALDVEQSPTFVETWKEMEKLLDTGTIHPLLLLLLYQLTSTSPGKVKSIGVSNFSIRHLETLLAHAKVVPVTNQVEVHPFYPSFELQKYCESKNILLTAYSPLGIIPFFFPIRSSDLRFISLDRHGPPRILRRSRLRQDRGEPQSQPRTNSHQLARPTRDCYHFQER